MAINKLALAFPVIPASVGFGIYKLWSPNVSGQNFIAEAGSVVVTGPQNTFLQSASPTTTNLPPQVEPATQHSQEIDLAEQQKLNKEATDKLFEKLDDYSFRIFWSCGIGTGWILDYELPENKEKYPTTWYIATAAHVINGYKFAENPYHQELSSSVEETKMLRDRLGEKTHYYLPWYARLSLWDHGATTCDLSNRYGYSDLNIAKSSNGLDLRAEYGGWLNKKIEEPKLFYAAVNLFDKNPELGIEDNNYKDFAVLEIKFKDSEYAKQVTRDFAGKYKVESTDAINVFAKSLDDKYSSGELLEKNFFELGYPKSNKSKYEQSKSWDEEKGEGYKLRGFGDSKGLYKVNWNDKERTDIGYFNLLEINPKYNLGGGASGSLLIDKNGELIGIHGGGGNDGTTSVIPLRGRERKGTTEPVKSPYFDLILGATNQKSSYRKQVETYKKNTWLNARGWEHKTKNLTAVS